MGRGWLATKLLVLRKYWSLISIFNILTPVITCWQPEKVTLVEDNICFCLKLKILISVNEWIFFFVKRSKWYCKPSETGKIFQHYSFIFIIYLLYQEVLFDEDAQGIRYGDLNVRETLSWMQCRADLVWKVSTSGCGKSLFTQTWHFIRQFCGRRVLISHLCFKWGNLWLKMLLLRKLLFMCTYYWTCAKWYSLDVSML